MGDALRATNTLPYYQPQQRQRGRAAVSKPGTAMGEADSSTMSSPPAPRDNAASILSMALSGEVTNLQLNAGTDRGTAARDANDAQGERGSFYFNLGRNIVQNTFEPDNAFIGGR